jgi:dephospho-CoA kinase
MRAPVIVVTGGIATGKTTVARVIAGRRGRLVDCDELGHRALADLAVRRRIVAAFGPGVLTRSGGLSRAKLARIAFSDDRCLRALNAAIRPRLRRLVTDEVAHLGARAEYIVLDAVLFFQYRFTFEVDRVIVTEAPLETRLKRIMRRDGYTREEALLRIARQRALEAGWARADVVLETDRPVAAVAGDARRIRDDVLREYATRRREKR